MEKSANFSGKFIGLLLCIAALFALSGCSSLDEALGYAKNSPDESQVITHKPLVNPQVASLPKPGDGVDNTIVPEPVDLEEKIRAQLEAEKKRGDIPEGVSPEALAKIKARKAEDSDKPSEVAAVEEKSAQEPAEKDGTDKKPWWKIW